MDAPKQFWNVKVVLSLIYLLSIHFQNSDSFDRMNESLESFEKVPAFLQKVKKSADCTEMIYVWEPATL